MTDRPLRRASWPASLLPALLLTGLLAGGLSASGPPGAGEPVYDMTVTTVGR